MSQPTNVQSTQKEGRLTLALQAYQARQFKTLEQAAVAFNVVAKTLRRRANGTQPRRNCQPNRQKLTPTEQSMIVQYILDLDSRGFSPRLCEVEDMANKLLEARGGTKVGKNWSSRFVTRSNKLKMSFNRAKDRQRAKQEDPVVISGWFQLVANTKAKYGIQDKDTYNFNESGFQMGVIRTIKVVTGSERHAQPDIVQPGDQEWVTVTQGVSAAGFAIPPFIIYKGRVHLSGWYQETGIPPD